MGRICSNVVMYKIKKVANWLSASLFSFHMYTSLKCPVGQVCYVIGKYQVAEQDSKLWQGGLIFSHFENLGCSFETKKMQFLSLFILFKIKKVLWFFGACFFNLLTPKI